MDVITIPQDILIVDDVKSYLDNLGLEVKLKMGIEPFLSDNPEQALEILQYYPIKVLVTDQIMPQMTGTELVKKVKRNLGLNIPFILLTGHADKVDVAAAVNLGFFRFIDKDRAHFELIEALRQALQRYQIDALRKSAIDTDLLLAAKTAFLTFRSRATCRIDRINNIEYPFIREYDWRSDLVAQRGVALKKEVELEQRVSSTYELGIEKELKTEFGFDFANVLGKLKSAIETRTTVAARTVFKKELLVKAKYTVDVKEISDKPTKEGAILQSREYQSAPVFTRVNCTLEIACSFCKLPHESEISICLPTDTFALRQVEHYDIGQPKIIYTGFLQGSIPS